MHSQQVQCKTNDTDDDGITMSDDGCTMSAHSEKCINGI